MVVINMIVNNIYKNINIIYVFILLFILGLFIFINNFGFGFGIINQNKIIESYNNQIIFYKKQNLYC